MAETGRLSECTEWIDLDFVERERTPHKIIEKVFDTILQNFHFRIQLFYLRSRVSNRAELQFTTGYRRPRYSQLTAKDRIALRSIRSRSRSITKDTGCTMQSISKPTRSYMLGSFRRIRS